MPPGLVTRTSAEPTECAGTLAWIVLTFLSQTRSAGIPPTATLAPAAKSLPEIATTSPPLVNPPCGFTTGVADVANGVLAEKLNGDAADTCPSTLVTVMSAEPVGNAGVR